MPAAVTPPTEADRLAALRALDAAPEPALDAIARLAADMLGAPIALVALVEADRQWFPARVGLDATETPRESAFCAHAILTPERALAIEDATTDARTHDNPLVTGAPGIRAYLGAPLVGADAHAYGTLCAIDMAPRRWSAEQIEKLGSLATIVVSLLETRAAARRATGLGDELDRAFRHLESISRFAGVGSWELELDTGRIVWSPETRRIHEVAPDYEPSLDTAIAFYAPEARPVIEAAVRHGMETGEPWDVELPFVTARGRPIWVRACGGVEHVDGRPAKLLGAFQDITERRRAEDERRAAAAELERFFDLSIDLKCIASIEGRFLKVNRAWEATLGRSVASLEGTLYLDLVHPDDIEETIAATAALAGGGQITNFVNRYLHADGGWRHLEWRASASADRIFGTARDISERLARERDRERHRRSLAKAKALAERRNHELAESQRRIEHLALHDPLTGLPNRRYLERALTEAARRAGATGGALALLHLDLDRFKSVNDTLGHAAGDQVLRHAAEVLRRWLRAGDFVARIGGDEFVVLLETDVHAEGLVAIGERLCAALSEPIVIEGHPCRLGASIGVACEPGASADPERLLGQADIALYRAKAAGRNRVVFFSDTLRAETVRRKAEADDILRAIEADEFEPYFQPQVCARSRAIVAVEALARWRHPREGVLSPARFVALAAELDVLATIDRRVLERSVEHARVWAEAGLPSPRVSVNVSARRLREPGLLAGVAALGACPGGLSFELVESIYLDDIDAIAEANLDGLRDLGVDL